MLQVATYLVPSEQKEANEFLKTHKPVGNINFNKDTIVLFYEEDPAADLVQHLESVAAARFQQQIALYMAKRDIAGLNRVKNKGKFEELDNTIRQIQESMDDQDAKTEYVKKLIAEKRASSAS